MGMFDSVVFTCSCGTQQEIQSKAGDCTLKFYSTDAVPKAIASAINGHTITCKTCGNRYTILDPSPEFVRLLILRERKELYND